VLADRYGVDYVVTEGRMDRSPVFSNSQFRIYAIGPEGTDGRPVPPP
jgi:hypothetical protein